MKGKARDPFDSRSQMLEDLQMDDNYNLLVRAMDSRFKTENP